MGKMISVAAKVFGFILLSLTLASVAAAPWAIFLENKTGQQMESAPLLMLPIELWAMVCVVFLTWLFTRFVEKRSLASAGLDRSEIARQNIIGAGVGAAMVAGMVAAPFLLGGVAFNAAAQFEPIVTLAIIVIAIYANAFMQELMFRGYVQTSVEREYGPAAGVFVAAVLFMLIHPDIYSGDLLERLYRMLNLFIAGVMLSYAFLVTKSIWLPTGIHFGWNIMSSVFSNDFIYSPFVDRASFFEYSQLDSILSGSDYERSIFGVISPLVLALVFYSIHSRRQRRL